MSDIPASSVTVADLYHELVGMRADVAAMLLKMERVDARGTNSERVQADQESRLRTLENAIPSSLEVRIMTLEKFRWQRTRRPGRHQRARRADRVDHLVAEEMSSLRNLKAPVTFGAADGVTISLGLVVSLTGQPRALFYAALGAGLAELVGMTAGQWLSRR